MGSSVAESFAMQKLLLAPQAVEDMNSWHGHHVPRQLKQLPSRRKTPLQHTASIAEPLQLGPPGQEGTQMAGEKPEMA